MAEKRYNFDDPLHSKTLVGVKWQGQYFHVVADGALNDEGVLLMVLTHAFPDEHPYKSTVQCIEYQCPRGSLREIHGKDHRYLCTVLLDLDIGEARI